MIIIFCLFIYVPEDSNSQHILDKQIAHYLPAWEARFDSLDGGLRTSQGCLDLLNWYIDLDTKFEVKLSKILGLRYRYKYLGDYDNHISNHRFEPFFKLRNDLKLFLTVTTHYYKGEDEIGIGFFLGDNYINYFEVCIVAKDFDRNFSLKDMPDGPDKILYKQHPIMVTTNLTRYWDSGHLALKFGVSNRFRLQSTETQISYHETGLHNFIHTRIWHDFRKLRLGSIIDLKKSEMRKQDTQTTAMKQYITDMYVEPMIAYMINNKWRPHLYLTYNYKTEYDSVHTFGTASDSLFDYQRDIYAYMIDVEFHPGGRFIWHFGMQQQFYYNNLDREFVDRRLLLGFEYRYKNIWFYFVEAMEGDYPMPKWLHNHTYVHLMLKF